MTFISFSIRRSMVSFQSKLAEVRYRSFIASLFHNRAGNQHQVPALFISVKSKHGHEKCQFFVQYRKKVFNAPKLRVH